jgi:hypothetical protein
VTELLSNYEGLIGALIGAATVLIANFITQSRTWHREDRLRNYETRRDAYRQLLYASNRVWQLLNEQEQNESHPTDELDKALDELLQSAFTLNIVAPSEVSELGQFVSWKAEKLVRTPRDEQRKNEREELSKELSQGVVKFIEAARRDLGLPSLGRTGFGRYGR